MPSNYEITSIDIYPQIFAYNKDALDSMLEDGDPTEPSGLWIGITKTDPTALTFTLHPHIIGQGAYSDISGISVAPVTGEGSLYIGVDDLAIYTWLSPWIGPSPTYYNIEVEGDTETSLYWVEKTNNSVTYVVPYCTPNVEGGEYAPIPIRIRYCMHVTYHSIATPSIHKIAAFPRTLVNGNMFYETVLNAGKHHQFTPTAYEMSYAPTSVSLYYGDGAPIPVESGFADINAYPIYAVCDYSILGNEHKSGMNVIDYNMICGDPNLTMEICSSPPVFIPITYSDWKLCTPDGGYIDDEHYTSPVTVYRKSIVFQSMGITTAPFNIIPEAFDAEGIREAYYDAYIEITPTISAAYITAKKTAYISSSDISPTIDISIFPNSTSMTDVDLDIEFNGYVQYKVGNTWITHGGDIAYKTVAVTEGAEAITTNTTANFTINPTDVANALSESSTITAIIAKVSVTLNATIEAGPYTYIMNELIYVGTGLNDTIAPMSLQAPTPQFDGDRLNKIAFTLQMALSDLQSIDYFFYNALPPYTLTKSGGVRIKHADWPGYVWLEFESDILLNSSSCSISVTSNYISLGIVEMAITNTIIAQTGLYSVDMYLVDSKGTTREISLTNWSITVEGSALTMSVAPSGTEFDEESEFELGVN